MTSYARLAVLAGALFALTAAAPNTPNTEDAAEAPAVAKATSAFHVELGDLLTLQRRFDAARQAYFAAVKLDREEGRLPIAALRRIANAFYFEGDYDRAAITLEGLADEAAEFDDLEAQAWALADAAWLTGLADEQPAMAQYLERLDRLCRTHGSLAELHREIVSKLMQDFRVFAPHLSSW